jgi:hypothetical protein
MYTVTYRHTDVDILHSVGSLSLSFGDTNGPGADLLERQIVTIMDLKRTDASLQRKHQGQSSG